MILKENKQSKYSLIIILFFTVFSTIKLSANNDFYSKGKNTPINGHKMKGKVIFTIVSGKIKYEKGKLYD